MYTIDDLNVRLLSELKDIADGMGVKNAKKLAKQELVYKILDQQAASGDPAPSPKKNEKTEKNERNDDDCKVRPRRRENVAPSVAPAQNHGNKATPANETLRSADLE